MMKKLAAALFFLMTAASFADHYDKEEHMLENKLYNNFPVLEAVSYTHLTLPTTSRV